MIRGLLVLFAIALAGVPSAGAATSDNAAGADLSAGSDWPHFLGPDRNASSPEKGLLRQWPEGGPKVLWKSALGSGWWAGGLGYGQPCVYRGEVFLLGNGAKEGGRCVWCLDAFTGEVRWEFNYETRKEDKNAAKKMEPGWGYCPRATVTATDEFVYSIDEIGELYCLDRKSGKEVWYRDLDADYKPSHHDWKGWCASPVVADGILVMPVSHDSDPEPQPPWKRLVGLDAKTGKTVWEYADTDPSLKGGGSLYVTPQPANFGDARCVIWSSARRGGKAGPVALRISNGEKVWESPVKAGASIASLQVMGESIYCGNKLLSVRRDRPPFETSLVWTHGPSEADYASGTPKWADPDNCIHAAPVRCGDYLYASIFKGYSAIGQDNDESRNAIKAGKTPPSGALNDPMLICIDLKTGRGLWRREEVRHGVSLLTADGLLFVRSKADLLLLEATPDEYREKGRVGLTDFQFGDNHTGWVMPVLAHGRLYVRCAKGLICLQAAQKIASAEEIRSAGSVMSR